MLEYGYKIYPRIRFLAQGICDLLRSDVTLY